VPVVIETFGLTKTYGRHRGVESLDLAVDQGQIFGFLGPNGAGKTTTIRLLLDLIRPTSGRIEVFGHDPRSRPALRRDIGYLPGDLRLPTRLTAREVFEYFGSLRGPVGSGKAVELARRIDLELDKPIDALSRGNKQKVGVVQAFMHRPRLLVLDEPTTGLDPLVQQVFADLVQEARADGATVFLSSHVLPEVQHIADRVALLRDGRLMLVESVDAIRARATARVEVAFAQLPPARAFHSVTGARELERHGVTVVFAVTGEADALVKELGRYHVVSLDSHEADLEDVFLSLYQEQAPRAV
jgi:ABC-2 type transport system ATP-binding protein